MQCAYDEVYLERARITLGWMFDIAVNTYKYELKEFFTIFESSDYAYRFEVGESAVIAGTSGGELAYKVLNRADLTVAFIEPEYSLDRSPEYWIGWSLAYYQWIKNMSFKNIVRPCGIERIYNMYSVFHEQDITGFVTALDKIRMEETTLNRLKQYRLRLGLSQAQLADRADIPVRTIQQYEQGQKDIKNAHAQTVLNLSKVLKCSYGDLLQ